MGCGPSSNAGVSANNSVGSRPPPRGGDLQKSSTKDLSALKSVDDRVRKTPSSATQTLQSLASYLGSAGGTELEKIRAIYKWVTANIYYDLDGLYGRKPMNPTDADSVLKNRSSVCDGYASLVLALFQLIGIECKKIIGYAKGVGYDPTEPLTTDSAVNHAWNAVMLDGSWKLLEATWGAGHVTNGAYVKEESDFYFLTDPEVFVEAHFPYMDGDLQESMKWQLLKKPIDLKTFHGRVVKSEKFFTYQVELVSHPQALVDISDEVTLKFRGAGKPLTSFSAVFVNTGSGQRIGGRQVAVFLDYRTNEASVVARPPTSGRYWQLEVFGGVAEGADSSDYLLAYQIKAKSDSNLPIFPDDSNFYGVHKNPEDFGFPRDFLDKKTNFLIRAQKSEYELILPTTQPVSALLRFKSADGNDNKKFSFLEAGPGSLKISLRMHQAGFHCLELFCKPIGSKKNENDWFANFLIECSSPMDQPRPFPQFYGLALSEQVILVSPRDGELPANSPVQFKLRTKTLGALMVNQTVYSNNGGGFDFTVNTGDPGQELSVYGAAGANASSFDGLFVFSLV